jgi:hypothetical protein
MTMGACIRALLAEPYRTPTYPFVCARSDAARTKLTSHKTDAQPQTNQVIGTTTYCIIVIIKITPSHQQTDRSIPIAPKCLTQNVLMGKRRKEHPRTQCWAKGEPACSVSPTMRRSSHAPLTEPSFLLHFSSRSCKPRPQKKKKGREKRVLREKLSFSVNLSLPHTIPKTLPTLQPMSSVVGPTRIVNLAKGENERNLFLFEEKKSGACVCDWVGLGCKAKTRNDVISCCA